MAQNFLSCEREQVFLMPPDPRDWLPEGHLAWFMLEAVGQLDLAPFYASYRLDGWGRAAFEPQMMLALLLYAYAQGERSSRGIERRCVEDVAYRVIAASQAPDHATIARFRVRHEAALAELFTEVLSLCREAGLVKVGLIAIDGTKLHASASHHANLDYEQLAREILKEEPPASTRPRTSSTASSAATSCPSSCGPAKGVGPRWQTPGASSSASASGRKDPRMPRWLTARDQRAWSSSLILGRSSLESRAAGAGSAKRSVNSRSIVASRRTQFRARDLRGCLRLSVAWWRTWRSSARPTRPMSTIARRR
jgi:transposase